MSRETNLDLVISEYFDSYIKQSNVLAAALTGSAGRGDIDEYSDVDAVVFTESEDKAGLIEGKVEYQGFLFDIRISNIVSLRETEWSEDMYFAYLNSKMIYDRDNQVPRLIEEKRVVWEEKCKSYAILSIVNLSVIFDFNGWRGLNAHSHYHKAIARGDMVSAHWILGNGLELILRTAYLLAHNPSPDQKNRTKFLSKFSILIEQDLLVLVEDALLVKNLEAKEASRRYEALMQVIEFIKQFIDSSNEEWPEDFYQFYIANRT